MDERRNASSENEKDVKDGIINLYQDTENFLVSDEYTEDLRGELTEAYPEYLTVLEKRREDMQKSDHGIVVAGETSAGKSILVNKILKKRIFISGNHESTSTVCKIRNSKKIKIMTETNDGEIVEDDLTNTCDLSTDEGLKKLRTSLNTVTNMSSEKSADIRSVEVEFPIPFLRGNTILVDTPGIGGSGTVTHKLLEYLPNAVSFIFVIDAGSAGGMQTDRLPEILKSIRLLQVNNDMPCFDAEDVIFLTNKWDTIRSEVSDDEEKDKTWKILQENIERAWQPVKDNNIFRMNLIEVSPGEKNSSVTEFNKFLDVLDSNVEKAENIRAERHLKFIEDFLKKVSFGLNARLQVVEQTEKELERKAHFNQQEMKRLSEECKEIRERSLDKLESFINDVSQRVYDCMSTDEGKEKILNPPGKTPIDTPMHIMRYPRIINERVNLFIEECFQSEKVLQRFENLKQEFLSDIERIASDLFKMEQDWINTSTNDTENVSLGMNLPHSIANISLLEFIVIFYRGLIFQSIADSDRKNTINRLYDKYKSVIKDLVHKHLESNLGTFFITMVNKVTKDWIPSRIKNLEKTVQTLLKNREKIIANQKSFTKLAEVVKGFQDAAKNLHLMIAENKIKGNTAGLF